MARGRTLSTYNTDLNFLPGAINFDVPDNLATQTALGWTAATAGAARRPARFTPRHAIGVDGTGRHVKVIIADVGADLWTGVARTWVFLGNDGVAETATVTGLVGEAASV